MIDLNQQLVEAIFGGPPLSPAILARFIAEHRFPVPALVYALPEEEALEEVFPRKELERSGALLKAPSAIIKLTLHPSAVYWFVPAKRLDPPPPRCYLGKSERLVYAIQQAILVLRQRELASQGDRIAPEAFSLQDEMQAFHLALQEVRKESAQAGAALDVWCEVILHRHQAQINVIRLKLVELLTALTRGCNANLAYASYSLIKSIYAEHRLSRIRALPHTIVAEIGPLVAGRHSYLEGTPLVASPAVQKAFGYMEQSYAQSGGIGLEEVAAASHVSPAHLARLFKKETGHTVVAHLHRLRVNRARELLATTSLSLIEVAMESGFESQEHFHRLFKRQCGVTPRTYRVNAFQGR